MKEYGIIDSGYLTSKLLEPYAEKYRDENNELKERIITVEEQEQFHLDNGWKPVDTLDESCLQCEDGYIVRIMPFDAGDRISYSYETVFDTQKVRRKIQSLKDELANQDYKVTKCYEATLIGASLPYDILSLHNERQIIRDEINELEVML